MKLDQLKTGFWGYQKASVYAYITTAEEEFSNQLLEKDSQYKKHEEQYQARIAALEEELHTVREQLNEQNHAKLEIASTLMAATQYAESMRQDAREKMQAEQDAWEKELDAMKHELDQYGIQVSKVREMLCALLHALEEPTQALEQQINTVKADCPNHNMTLFERKRESET